MVKDIGNKCIKCFEDTSFGSGRFVNRIIASDDDYDGYICPNCSLEEEEDFDEETDEFKYNEEE